MAEQITAPLLDETHAPEVGIRNGRRNSAPERPFKGKAQFMYHRTMSGRAFTDSPDASEGQREYNRVQRETLDLCREVERGPDANEDCNKEERYESLAITLSNSANVVLLIIKIFASVKSRSLAIAASTLESLLDLLAGVILLFTRWAMHSENIYKYPIGKLRVQPVGIIIFAAIMATLGFQVFITAMEQLMEGNTAAHKMNLGELVWLSVVMGIATAAKLALFVFCRTFKSPIVQAYSQDHCFDALTNLVGVGAALLANWYYWWIDPVGALLLAIFTIFEWSKTVLENAESLVGQAAPPEFIRKVTFITLSHDDRIKRIDTVRAYTFGSQYFVEVDIELPEEMHLREAHDIGESLQNKLEALVEVERAYVHLDFESTHHPEHTGQQHHETLA